MKRKFLSATVLFILSFSSMLFSCSKSKTNTPPPANTINLNGAIFSPSILTVTPGTTVTWNNNDVTEHTVTANGGSFDSGSIAIGSTFTKTFSTPGSFPYHCSFHSGMTGTIVVQ